MSERLIDQSSTRVKLWIANSKELRAARLFCYPELLRMAGCPLGIIEDGKTYLGDEVHVRD